MSLSSNLMIRRGMIPLSEGLRLHSINNRALGLFLRVAASSNKRINIVRFRSIMLFVEWQFSGLLLPLR
jgi:hypothetical protein